MKHLHPELPDKVVQRMEALVKEGWFRDEHDLVRTALIEFLATRQIELREQFQRDDIDWARSQKAVGR